MAARRPMQFVWEHRRIYFASDPVALIILLE
jgi:hypothetical protein